MRKFFTLAAIIAAISLFVVPFGVVDAQRPGKGKGNKWPKIPKGMGNPKDLGKILKRLPKLKIEDVKANGVLEVYSLLPTSDSQPVLGVECSSELRWC
ncbi:MAG: hypothetical protein V3V10_04285 [Planctomycetota bacterium]